MERRSEQISDSSKIQQALSSAQKANHAVQQAEDHPSNRMQEQADNSLASAEQAVRQAQQTSIESSELERAAEQVEEGRSELDGLSS